MSESESATETAVSGFLQQVGRGIVSFLILQYSLGIGVRAVVNQAVGPTPIASTSLISTIAVALVVATLINYSKLPSYRRQVGFTVVALAIGITVTTLVMSGDGHVGGLYPTLQTGLSWLGAFLIAYAVAFEVEWSRVVSCWYRVE
ncbi:hypothetical protein [Haloferax sp. ATB1]|uniref:hypothetical protein n=1 Tax=Haloferax sp. ATB1 TaxID=1508454 RepID=UPI0005B1D21C|nr:hypothetical protein [Haloferax sp. ATB1]